MNLQIEKEMAEGLTTLYLSGEVDVYTAPELKEALYALVQQEHHKVILDLKNVQYMDSTGLGIIIGAIKLSKQMQSSITLQHPSQQLQRLFNITGVADIVHVK